MLHCFLVATDFSVSLDINCRVLTGRKFLLMGWRPYLLSTGCTKGHFQSLAKYSVYRGMLTILGITESMLELGQVRTIFYSLRLVCVHPPQTTARLWIPRHGFRISVTGVPISCH